MRGADVSTGREFLRPLPVRPGDRSLPPAAARMLHPAAGVENSPMSAINGGRAQCLHRPCGFAGSDKGKCCVWFCYCSCFFFVVATVCFTYTHTDTHTPQELWSVREWSKFLALHHQTVVILSHKMYFVTLSTSVRICILMARGGGGSEGMISRKTNPLIGGQGGGWVRSRT